MQAYILSEISMATIEKKTVARVLSNNSLREQSMLNLAFITTTSATNKIPTYVDEKSQSALESAPSVIILHQSI